MTANENLNGKNSDELSLKELILKIRNGRRYVMSKWYIILVVALIGGLIGFAYAIKYKPLYTASSTFVLEEGDTGGGLAQYAGLASMVGINVGDGGGLFQGDNIIELYKSRAMVEQALLSEVEYDGKKHILIERYIEYSQLKDKWAEKGIPVNINFNAYGAEVGNRLRDSIVGSIVADIKANNLFVMRPDKKLSIIQVDVKAEDETFAKLFNNQIVKKVNDFYVQTKTKKSLNNVVILQEKADSVKNVMNGAIYTASTILDATPNLNPTRSAQRSAPVQRSQFSAETNKAILGELVKNLELSKLTLLKEAPLIQVIDQPILPLPKSKLGVAKAFIVGALIAGFLALVFLIMRFMLSKLLADT